LKNGMKRKRWLFFDAVLCLGPLYHLNEEEDRTSVIKNCLEVLNPGGIIAFGFICAFAKYTAVLKFLKYFMNDDSKADFMREKYFEVVPHLLNYVQNKSLVFERTDDGFTESNFTSPHHLIDFLESFGIETIVLTSPECLLTHYDELRYLPKDIYDSLLDVTYYCAKDPSLLGSSEHLLYLGRKK
jgi:S-adenosylmethionine-dependent methyltransferase